MRICVISPAVLPILGKDQQYGGIEVVVSIAVEEMVRRGHEVYLFASGDSKTSAKLEAIAPKALGQGVAFQAEKQCNHRAYQRALKLKPDVIWDNTLAIHAHDMQQNEAQFIFKADIKLKPEELINTGSVPVVQTLHGPAKEHLPALVHDLSLNGHYFVSISYDQARRYKKFIAGKQHLNTVYNAVNTDMFVVDESKKTADYLLWVGRYGMEKGSHIVLEVGHRLNLPVRLLGKKAEPHEKSYYKKFIEPNLRPDDIVYDSSLPVAQKISLFQGAKATVMANLWPEPFGIVIAESMACGTPVVGPALGSLPELINGAGLLVPIKGLRLNEDDTKISASQLKYIDRMTELIGAMDKIPSRVPRKRAEYLFSPKHIVDGYEEAFVKAIYLKNK